MAKYDKFGVAKDGSVNDLRKTVSNIMHVFGLGAPSGTISRETADSLYRTMKEGGSYGGWTGGKASGGKEDEEGKEDGGAGSDKRKDIDIDFNMKGELRKAKVPGGPNRVGSKLSALESQRMNKGGMVRGCGQAQRGRGRGKMV